MIAVTDLPRSSAFSTRPRLSVASAIASTSLLVGFGVAAAMPASAAIPTDCVDDGTANDNTLSASSGDDRADIQALLDGSGDLVCLSGTFEIDETLTVARDVELYGLASAVLSGIDVQILQLVGGNENEIIVENVTFQNGSAGAGQGGAIDGYYVTVINSTFLNNVSANGGAIRGYGVDVFGSTFESNFADFETEADGEVEAVRSGSGGAISAPYVAIDDSTFTDNGAIDDGGAIEAVVVDVTNSTFVQNAAGFEGGAVWTQQGQVAFSTFLNNTAIAPVPEEDLPGNAIYLSNRGESTLSIRGNIFAGTSTTPQIGVGNIVTPTSVIDLAGNIFTTSRSVEEDVPNPADPTTRFLQSLTAIFGATPALADNGGPTETVKIVSGGPAIDAVPPLAVGGALAPAALEVDADQRGEPRVGDFVDAGAFELQADEIGGDGVLADGGVDEVATTWLGGAAALLLVLGTAFVIGTRRITRHAR